MTVMKEIRHKEVFMVRLRHGADLLEEITGICRERGIRLGRIEAIGAVKNACVGFYDQERRVYEFIAIKEPMEILNLTGNVSIKDGAPFVHAHITLANASGMACGGHLASGTTVFACELTIVAFDGPELKREPDQETGLSLWKMEE